MTNHFFKLCGRFLADFTHLFTYNTLCTGVLSP